VWLPSETAAMKHADDCPNKYSFPYRSACKATCRNLTQAEVIGAPQVSALQAEGERKTTQEGLEGLVGGLRGLRPRLEAKGFMRMLQESAGTELNPYDKNAVANHLRSLGADINPEDITDTLLKNLIEASEPVYTAQDERAGHNKILVDLAKSIDGIDSEEMERRLSRVSWGAGTKNYEFQRGKGLPPNPTFIQQMAAAKEQAAKDAAAAKKVEKEANKKKKTRKRSQSGKVKTRQATFGEQQTALNAAADRKAAREVITRDND
jgi:hypothetical protein